MQNTLTLWSMSKLKEAGFQHRKYTLEELNEDPEPDKDVLNYTPKEVPPVALDAFTIYENHGPSDIPALEETNLAKNM